jgi:hypothetical protein
MKKSTLKSLIRQIIRESVIDNLTNQKDEDENRMMGLDNLKHRQEFNRGRTSSMGFVNVEEKVGFDGKYVDDMESGTEVKRIHNLNEDDDEKLIGKFVNRGEVKLEGGLSEEIAKKIAEYHWDVFNYFLGERGVWQFQTRGNKWCCSVGKLNGRPAMLNITTEPGRLQLLIGNELGISNISEMTGTGAVAGYQTPFSFTNNKKGSKRALDITKKLGYKEV